MEKIIYDFLSHLNSHIIDPSNILIGAISPPDCTSYFLPLSERDETLSHGKSWESERERGERGEGGEGGEREGERGERERGKKGNAGYHLVGTRETGIEMLLFRWKSLKEFPERVVGEIESLFSDLVSRGRGGLGEIVLVDPKDLPSLVGFCFLFVYLFTYLFYFIYYLLVFLYYF